MATKSVVAGVDGSEESLRAVEWAALEAKRHSWPLRRDELHRLPGPRARSYVPAARMTPCAIGMVHHARWARRGPF